MTYLFVWSWDNFSSKTKITFNSNYSHYSVEKICIKYLHHPIWSKILFSNTFIWMYRTKTETTFKSYLLSRLMHLTTHCVGFCLNKFLILVLIRTDYFKIRTLRIIDIGLNNLQGLVFWTWYDSTKHKKQYYPKVPSCIVCKRLKHQPCRAIRWMYDNFFPRTPGKNQTAQGRRT